MTKVTARLDLSSLRHFLKDFFAFAGWKGVRAAVLVFFGVIVEGVGLILLVPFFAVIMGTEGSTGWLQQTTSGIFTFLQADTRVDQLLLLLLCFGVLVLIRAVIVTIRDVMLVQLEMRFVQSIRSRVAHGLAAARWDVISRLRHSRIAHLMSADIQGLSSATRIVIRDAVAIIMLASQIAIAFLLAPWLALFSLALVMLGATTLPYLLRHARRFGGIVTEANLGLIDDMVQFLGALKLSIGQNLQNIFTTEFDQKLEALSDRRVQYIRQQTAIRAVIATLSALAGGIAVFVGAIVLELPPETLIALLLVLSRMNGPATQLQNDAQSFAHALPAYEKILELESDLAATRGTEHVVAKPLPQRTDITFENVSFLHAGRADGDGNGAGGVRDLSLTLPAGSIVGVAGSSGAGKTTFADLLVGLFPPQSGVVSVGGVARDENLIAAWRDAVSYVAQDPFLFHDTIRRNLSWGNDIADEKALWDALRLVGAETLVRSLAKGLDTVVGERGSLLSGGERQRINLARAILRRPRLLVLDEATNAIDEKSERDLYERLADHAPQMTMIVIAHRLDGLRRFPRLIVMDQGRIIADGTPVAVLAEWPPRF